jgi:hypothetical protein
MDKKTRAHWRILALLLTVALPVIPSACREGNNNHLDTPLATPALIREPAVTPPTTTTLSPDVKPVFVRKLVHEDVDYGPKGVILGTLVRISYLENQGVEGNVVAWVERVQGSPEARKVFRLAAGERVQVEVTYATILSRPIDIQWYARASLPGDTEIANDRAQLEVVRLPGFPWYPDPVPDMVPVYPSPTPGP